MLRMLTLIGFPVSFFVRRIMPLQQMWKLVGLIIIASTALLLSSFAESEPALRDVKFAQFAPRRSEFGKSAPALNARQSNRPGNLAWRDGHWRHTTRKGRLGWWWVVGGIWYFYPESIDGPPDYVSDTIVDERELASPPKPTKPPPQTFYYAPGSLTGTGYPTVDECRHARDSAGGVGVCVIK